MYSLGAKNDLCREPASHLLLVLSGRTLENRELIPKPQHHVYTQNTAHVTFRRLASNCFITITYTIWGFNLTCSMHMHSPVHLRKKISCCANMEAKHICPKCMKYNSLLQTNVLLFPFLGRMHPSTWRAGAFASYLTVVVEHGHWRITNCLCLSVMFQQ